MSLQTRALVEQKLQKTRSKSPLSFYSFPFNHWLVSKYTYIEDIPVNMEEIRIMNANNKNLGQLILEILTLSNICVSVSRTLRYETRRGARRSAIDIWRHVKYYKPDVTLIDVMKEIHNQRAWVSMNFCNAVRRLVFVKRLAPSNASGNSISEFGVRFEDWRDL